MWWFAEFKNRLKQTLEHFTKQQQDLAQRARPEGRPPPPPSHEDSDPEASRSRAFQSPVASLATMGPAARELAHMIQASQQRQQHFEHAPHAPYWQSEVQSHFRYRLFQTQTLKVSSCKFCKDELYMCCRSTNLVMILALFDSWSSHPTLVVFCHRLELIKNFAKVRPNPMPVLWLAGSRWGTIVWSDFVLRCYQPPVVNTT